MDLSRWTVVLASRSPRRHDLLKRAGVSFETDAADIDEEPLKGETPLPYVARMAHEKCETVFGQRNSPAELVIAADTIVEIDHQILGKPVGLEEAHLMLRRLSGRTHRVHTAVAVQTLGFSEVITVTTKVTFATLSESDITWYLGLNESLDKAGAYAIQSGAATLIERIDGSPSNVIGLPMYETRVLLNHANAVARTSEATAPPSP